MNGQKWGRELGLGSRLGDVSQAVVSLFVLGEAVHGCPCVCVGRRGHSVSCVSPPRPQKHAMTTSVHLPWQFSFESLKELKN